MTKPLFQCISNVYRDEEGRLIIFDLKQDLFEITIAAIYAPNIDSPGFFDTIEKVLKLRSEKKVIIGDFNLTITVDIDRLNTYHNNNKARDKILDIMDQFCLKDVWRCQNPQKKEYSWIKSTSGPNSTSKASRIDFALVSGGLDQQVECPMYINNIKSDHRAFYMVVETTTHERGRGFWKFNNNLLRDKNFLDMMNRELDYTITLTAEKSSIETWEIIKKRIKKATLRYTRSKTTEEQLVISNLAEKVSEYESSLPLPRDQVTIYEETKGEYEDLILSKTQGVMFRSKAKWYEEGEKNTKYFYSLEKAKYNAKHALN